MDLRTKVSIHSKFLDFWVHVKIQISRKLLNEEYEYIVSLFFVMGLNQMLKD